MHEAPIQDEPTLQAQLSLTHEKLDGLVRDVREIESELDGLSTDRDSHRLLEQVCEGLEKLDALGGAALFWGEGDGDQTLAHVHRARGRIQAFEKSLGEIEDRRELALDAMERVQQDAEFLEDDLFEAEQRAERKKQDWLIEREVDGFPVRPSIMPWSRGREDDQRFRKALAAALLLSLLLGVVFPLIDLPIAGRWEAIELPERLTRLIQERRQPPPPVLAETRPEETKELTEEPAKEKTTPEKPAAPRGILAFREKFSGLAESRTPTRLGAQARIRNPGQALSGRPTRSLVAIQTQGSSGGIDVGSLSRDGGGGGEGLEGVDVARATSTIGAGTGPERPLSDGPGPARTDEEIQIVFDRHKAALYRLYNRELRRDPTLKGQIVLRIRIEPDGSVSLCEVQSTDMKAPHLSAQVVARVEKFEFGAKEDVSPITILYPIDFLPAT